MLYGTVKCLGTTALRHWLGPVIIACTWARGNYVTPLYSPNLNALLYQIVRKRKIQKKYFLYFKYKIHVLYFVTFSGTSILYFILIHLFEGYFVFCIKIHFDVFLPISVYALHIHVVSRTCCVDWFEILTGFKAFFYVLSFQVCAF